jgi:cellulose biosynthesis protein BcsQ
VHFNIEWIGSIATALAVLGTFIWWAINGHLDSRQLRKVVTERDATIAKLEKEIDSLERENGNKAPAEREKQLAARIAELKQELKKVRVERAQIIAKGDELVEVYQDLRRRTQADLARLADEKKSVEGDLKRLAECNEEFSERVADLEKQLDGMKDQDGRVWHRPSDPAKAPRFRPRSERGYPIISVLNLKGGVGKTTITAHLAGALGLKGKRVLMVDLDYQRSLSTMLVPVKERTILSLQGHCVQHFLGGQRHAAEELLACAHAVGDAMPGCAIVTNSDAREQTGAVSSLEETESRLLAEWTVRPEAADVRLFLREGLHAAALARRYDYVLLDCPPRLTTACVNALAASDFVLIPVVPDALSTRSVPELLRSLSALRGCVAPDLAVLGVVANLATLLRGELIRQEAEVWESLPYGLGAVWDGRVHFFSTKVPDKSQFGRAAGSLDDGELRLALNDPAVKCAFDHLVTEIEKEIDSHERRHAATIPS